MSIVLILSLSGCSDKYILEQELALLEEEKDLIELEIEVAKDELELHQKILSDFKIENNIVEYIITVEIKQSHFTLDIGKHIKDEMNAIEIQIPVSEYFYESCNIGDVLSNEFRTGSFWTEGSIGSWDIEIVNKRIV